MSRVSLAIVGSTCALQKHAQPLIDRAIAQYQPDEIVSGGAVGVDTYAEETAQARGIPCVVYLPKERNWERGFKPRNIEIATRCTVILAIRSQRSSTFGSGWTFHYATKTLGKPGELVMVP